jgi:hypothetical protein
MKPRTPARLRAAWIIALAVDAIQIGISIAGPLSIPLDAVLDSVTMLALWRILGWHWALLPSFVFELLPVADMAPTWSLAVWIITAQKRRLEKA